MNKLLVCGGGGGICSQVIVLKNGELLPFNWSVIRGSFENAEELYFSIVENDIDITLLELEGKIVNQKLQLVGRDYEKNIAYILNEDSKDIITLSNLPVAKGNGENSTVEGLNTIAESDWSHAEGFVTKTMIDTTDPDLRGRASHAEGSHTTAKGSASHAEGSYTTSTGIHSHAEGYYTDTIGNDSHAEGYSTHTNNLAEHAEGCFNVSHMNSKIYGDALNTQHSIGIGTAEIDPETGKFNTKNAVEVMQNGDVYIIGVGGYDGSNIDTAQTVQEVIANLK